MKKRPLRFTAYSKHAVLFFITLFALSNTAMAQVWVADQGDGTYINPIIHADYSDPDVIRVEDDYFMVASSFNCAPGIPLLHSKDLVNWEVINYIYTSLPFSQFQRVAHGRGSWAPSIRYNKGTFYVYFCTPDEGLFAATTTDPFKKWKLHHVLNVQQWEDPCPLWDNDGQAWLVRSKLCGGPVYLHKMSNDGLKLLDNGKIIYWDAKENPTLEGLKIMKRNSYYYILAPAGGVTTGWQTVLRSKDINGPYESRKVLDEGNGINGPHQGGLVSTTTGEWWFIHFQDKQAYGRILHLQPAQWLDDDWVVIGDDSDGDGCGIPVLSHKKPNVGKEYPIKTPQTSDDFNSTKLGLQWQWHGEPKDSWYSLKASKGSMRLYPVAAPTEKGNLHYTPNLLLQKMAAPAFKATTAIDASALKDNERAGLMVSGSQHTYICVEKIDGKFRLAVYYGQRVGCGFEPRMDEAVDLGSAKLLLRVDVTDDQQCYYSYSTDGQNFKKIGNQSYGIYKGGWIGAKVGLFCVNVGVEDGSGYADFDYINIEKN